MDYRDWRLPDVLRKIKLATRAAADILADRTPAQRSIPGPIPIVERVTRPLWDRMDHRRKSTEASTPPFHYPADVLASLRESWGIPGWREPDPVPLPEDTVLQEILEIVYHASFTAEERRATSFSLVFSEPLEARGSLIFERARDFSVHEIMRLAPAADIKTDLIGIHLNKLGILKIWGLAGDDNWGHPVFTAPSPGTIEVRRYSRSIFSLRGGAISPSVTIDEYFINRVFEDAATSLVSDFLDSRGPMGNALDPFVLYGTPLLELLQEASRHGHGATVFVLPDASAKSGSWNRWFRLKYQCEAQSLWPALRQSARGMVYALSTPLEEGEDEQVAEIITANSDQDMKQWLERVARLSRVDGGVLMTDRYNLLGFGAEVVATADELRTVRVTGALDEDIDQYGTRHRSAFRLCYRYPEAVVFVCSQDGGIKCVRNLNGVVTLWK